MESKSRFFITIILFFLLLSIHCSTNPIKQESDFVITDIDGNTYKTVSIGDQEWMTENLKTTHFQNGDQIFNVLND